MAGSEELYSLSAGKALTASGGGFRVGVQAQAGLAAAGQRRQQAAVPVADGRDAVLVEAFDLERLVIELFQLRRGSGRAACRRARSRSICR